MWNAADDYRNENFIETNLTFLSQNNDFVASTSPNCFEDNNKLINFSLTGDFENRLFTFLITAGIPWYFLQFNENKNY